MGRQILCGRVIHGADRGKDLGFPTANLDIPSGNLPKTGVYAVWARVEGEQGWRPGAANIGFNPTFGEKTKKVEVHLLRYSGDLYGKSLEILPVRFLRPERRYGSTARLIRQMHRDCRRSERLLTRSGPP